MQSLPRQTLFAYWLIMMVLAALSCSLGTPVPTPTPVDCKKAIEPSKQDVEYALTFTGDTFQSAGWQRSYTVGEMRVSVAWLKNDEGALAYLEYLIFSCGYTQAQVDNYFSEQNFKEILFRDYQNLQQTARCTDNKSTLTLREFTAESNGKDYLIRYWTKADSKTRILTMMLAFPRTSGILLNEYARDIFPKLSSCQE